MSVGVQLPSSTIEIQMDYIFRLSVEQYHEMVHSGILTEDDPVELLDGWLVEQKPKKPSHTLSTRLM